ncbi:hypothetical protein Gorai_005912 [Gossypium raimondii]|uniref:Uncharacterized protein n=1 Tax=Gossypium raimondii TaxID=29730 RepID=A0A7J8QDP5_GOSRA|nr:hypothetical protein [Gossypium raimondii]
MERFEDPGKPYVEFVSSRKEWRDLIRDDDRLLSLNQFVQEIDSELFLLLLKYKLQMDDDRLLSLNQFDQEIDSELLDLLLKYKLQILLEMVKLFINQ